MRLTHNYDHRPLSVGIRFISGFKDDASLDGAGLLRCGVVAELLVGGELNLLLDNDDNNNSISIIIIININNVHE